MEYSSNGKKDTVLRRNFALKLALMTDMEHTWVDMHVPSCPHAPPATFTSITQASSGGSVVKFHSAMWHVTPI